MRFRPATLAVLLVLGAVANVGVSWLCQRRAIHRFDFPVTFWAVDTRGVTPQPFDGTRVWADHRLPDWPSEPTAAASYRTFGHTLINIEHMANDDIHQVRSICEYRAGFPFRSLRVREVLDQGPTHVASFGLIEVSLDSAPFRGATTGIPIDPLVPGFVGNSLAYATSLGLLFLALASWRGAARRRRGLCPYCCYPIGASHECTECGRRLTALSANSDERKA